MSASSRMYEEMSSQQDELNYQNSQVPVEPEPQPATFKTEREVLKEIKDKLEKEKNVIKMEISTNKALVYKGIPTKITDCSVAGMTKGRNFRIDMTGKESFYYNSILSDDSMVKKLFPIGEVCAFTIIQKPNKKGVIYNIISQVLFTF